MELSLTQGQVAYIDDEDYERCKNNKWHAFLSATGRFYAARTVHDRKQYLHHFLLGYLNGLEIDHIDGNPLNNRKANLRFVTHQQNHMNRLPRRNTTSKYKGVHFHKKSNRWRAAIKKDGKYIEIGTFKKEDDAARCYDLVAKKLFGEFCRLNFLLSQ
jgi:hypothetical protein